MSEWGALPPEDNSAGFWFGPGASSFLQGAEQFLEVAGAMFAILGGLEAVAAALAAAWPDPTGEFAVLANVPHLLWQARLAGMLMDAAARIEATGTAFETLKAATPTPFEIGENQTEHVALQAHNFLGMLTPAIVANRANYSRMWVTAAGNKYSYAAASASGVQAIPPLDPPPPTTVGGGGDPTMAMGQSSQNPADSLVSGGPEMAMQFMQPLTQMGSQVGQLGGTGGPMQGLTQVFSPLQSLMSSMGGMGNPATSVPGGGAGEWLTATPAAGGPVAANMVSGGGSGVGGFGALRGPVGWASSPTVNAAAPDSAEAATVSRLGEAKAAAGAPVNSAGMGGSGGMMGPMAHGAGEQNREEAAKQRKSPLTSLAALYRSPAGLPVITGSGGAVFQREEVGVSA
ncbi:PPE family protein [Mycobacterium kansasii]